MSIAGIFLLALGAVPAADKDTSATAVLDLASTSCAQIGIGGRDAPEGWRSPIGDNRKLAKQFEKEAKEAFRKNPLFKPEIDAFENTFGNRSLLMVVVHFEVDNRTVATTCAVRDFSAKNIDWLTVAEAWAGREAESMVQFVSPTGAEIDEARERKRLPLHIRWKPGLANSSVETTLAYWHGNEVTRTGITPGLTYSETFSKLQ